MAELLGEHKLESAKIRVENIIRSDITTELHEILELYCELLLARIQLLDAVPNASSSRKEGEQAGYEDVDPGLLEAVRALVYAAPKTEIKELSLARALLVEKFGKDFALETQGGTNVPERVLSRLRVETPNMKLVEEYLREIARTYGVRFPVDPVAEDEEEEEVEEEEVEDDDEGDGDGGGKEKPIALQNPWQAEELSRATPPRDDVGRPSPLRIAPPSPTTENVSPELKLPGGDTAKGVKAPPVTTRKASTGGVTKPKKTATPAKKKDEDKSTSEGGPGGKIPGR